MYTWKFVNQMFPIMSVQILLRASVCYTYICMSTIMLFRSLDVSFVRRQLVVEHSLRQMVLQLWSIVPSDWKSIKRVDWREFARAEENERWAGVKRVAIDRGNVSLSAFHQKMALWDAYQVPFFVSFKMNPRIRCHRLPRQIYASSILGTASLVDRSPFTL